MLVTFLSSSDCWSDPDLLQPSKYPCNELYTAGGRGKPLFGVSYLFGSVFWLRSNQKRLKITFNIRS